MKIKRNGKILIISVLSVIVLISGVIGINLYEVFHRTTNSPILDNASREEKWLSDLNFVKKELPKKHKNLFFSMTRSDFYKQMDLLISNINQYDDTKIKGELAKVINSVNDSHTSVDMRGSLIYPLSFFEFKEGIYLTNASLEYKDFWGKKLAAINGYSVEQLRSKLNPYISHDNQSILKNEFCDSLKYVQTLEIAGISKNEEAIFTFDGAAKKDITVKPLKNDEYMKVKALTDVPEYLARFPVVKKNMDKNYWFDYSEKTNSVYVKYNSCSNTPGYSFDKFTKDVFNVIDGKNARTLIIDLRDNGGGNSAIFNPFMRAIKKRADINNKEHLFVIIGRRTFSSAVLNAMDLRNYTNATLIGEPSGGRPNHFGEVKILRLSNVKVDIYYSSNYFKTTKNDTDSIYPDVSIRSSAESYFSARDDCLEYINSRLGNEHNK